MKDLAAKTQLSVPYLSDVERRVGANPTLETLTAIATALDCDVAELIGQVSEGKSVRALPSSVQRFSKTEAFARRVRRIAEGTGRAQEDVVEEVLNFLATAPKRSSGELNAEDWTRLLDFYAGVILHSEP